MGLDLLCGLPWLNSEMGAGICLRWWEGKVRCVVCELTLGARYPACIWVPAPQLPGGKSVERAAAFVNLGLPLCAMRVVLANLTGLWGVWRSTFSTEHRAGTLLTPCEGRQSCPTLCNPMNCSLPGSSVHGIFLARILERVAISFSRGSS